MAPRKNANERRIVEIKRAFDRCGVKFCDFTSQWEEVILFGSRASDHESRNSDWDLLCIGSGVVPAIEHVDFVVVDDKRWDWFLGSELGHHVAEYGNWICGDGEWVSGLKPQLSAAKVKTRRIQVRCDALVAAWTQLNHKFRRKWKTLIRRDMQRLLLLWDDKSVPDSVTLDQDHRGDSEIVSLTIEGLRSRHDFASARSVEKFRRVSADCGCDHKMHQNPQSP